MTIATCRTSTPQLLKRRQYHKTKLTFERNEVMHNFLLVLRALIANRFCWEGRELGAGAGAGGQEILPVGSGGAESVLLTVS